MEHYDGTPKAIKGMPVGHLHPPSAIIWAPFQDISQNGKRQPRQKYEKQTKESQSVIDVWPSICILSSLCFLLFLSNSTFPSLALP